MQAGSGTDPEQCHLRRVHPSRYCRRLTRHDGRLDLFVSNYGPDRLCWGSDYPVVRRAMTYRQALEAVRVHCPFIPTEHKERILGGNLERLLAERAR